MKVVILGAGGWGTAFSVVLASKNFNVTLLGRNEEKVAEIKKNRENRFYLPGVKIPESVEILSNPDVAFDKANIIVITTPAQFVRDTLILLKELFPKEAIFVSGSKGLERSSYKRVSEVIFETTNSQRIAVLSGPSHAEEVARGLPCSVVVSSKDNTLSKELQEIFNTTMFRVYTNGDILGVELAGALKNVIAIASGICEGLGFGDNTKSALMSRGLVEIVRLGVAMGARKSTFFGLAGLGDLITTCNSKFGRNRFIGLQIAKRIKLDDLLKTMTQVAEGVWTVLAAVELAKKHSVEMPITQEVYNTLYKNKNVKEAIQTLMSRTLKSEEEDLLT